VNGSVAVVTLAGGQGTRLGFAGPKGAYSIGLPSKVSLFGLFAQRIVRVQTLAIEWALEHEMALPPGGPRVQWLIMTSPLNHDDTVRFFEGQEWFGLDRTQIQFFQQGTRPALSPEKRLILDGRAHVAEVPDGNGGVYAALLDSGALDKLDAAGVTWLHVHSVDNALTVTPDPVLLGFTAAERGSGTPVVEVGCNVVRKTRASEKIGVFATVDAEVSVLEYSEIPSGLVGATTSKGGLAFGGGNICNHVFSTAFVRRAAEAELRYHRALKKIPLWDWITQSAVQPADRNGYKLESFIFDGFR
jgi:UDP-N-acetylglucosamine/UDP-N-acetylgalactosamine diphosphorylase